MRRQRGSSVAKGWLPTSQTFLPADLDATGPGRKSISVLHDHEVRDWCRSLACTESELRAAIDAVGNSADRVREVLRRKGGRSGATDDVPE